MTVMDAPNTGELKLGPTSATPQTDAIVADLVGPVWTLMQGGELRGALVLMRARIGDFNEAWRREYVGLPATLVPEAPEPTNNCISHAHALLSCAQALAEGVLPEDEPFCKPCAALQLSAAETPHVAEEGRVVHVVTTVGTTGRKAC